jgi:hypothetical protein
MTQLLEPSRKDRRTTLKTNKELEENVDMKVA